MATLNYETDGPSLFDAFTPESFALFEQEPGPLTSNIPEGGSFFRTRPELEAPDLEIHLAASMYYDEGLTAPHGHGYVFGSTVVKPTGRGRVMLRTPLADSKPRVLCNFLTTEEDCRDDDRRRQVGARDRRAGAAAEASIAGRSPFRRRFRRGDPRVRSRGRIQTVYHPTSTCAIGSVVDPELRVYGTEGLRVADASVMPTITRANTNATAIMIGEKAADLISAGS